jgi:imidazolonepropionase-like amidohydrolase
VIQRLSRSGVRALVAVAAIALAAGRAPAQDLGVKAPAQAKPIAIVHAEIQPVSSDVLPDGFILFDKGVITALGDAATLDVDDLRKRGFEVIDYSGKGARVYPGFIAPYTQLGLAEIAAVRATLDYAEVGSVTPEARAVVAVNPDSTLIPVTRSNGVLLAGVFPITTSSGLINYFDGPGGLIPGRAGVIRLDGWTWEDMTVRDDAGLVLNWPMGRPLDAWWMNKSEQDQQKEIDAELTSIEKVFTDAQAYVDARVSDKSLPTDIRFEAMRSVLPLAEGASEGAVQRPVFILANDYDQITQAVSFCAKHRLKCVIVGGKDAPLCAELLKRHNAGVIVQGTIGFPKRDDSPYDDAFTLPARLQALGVRWTLASGEEAAHERNLSYAAALACAYGLSPDAGVRAVTLSAAEMLGIARSYGSLVQGKSATLFVCNGDPLELSTRLERAFIDGRAIDLRNKQTELDRKYRLKYAQPAPAK